MGFEFSDGIKGWMNIEQVAVMWSMMGDCLEG